MSEPLIDILMAAYNGERFIGEQIESIQAQTYGNWRLLVSDDCSTDGTLDVVRRYDVVDERIHIVSEGVRHGGAKENFFALMAMSTAPYIMFCDQDDVWLPEKVEKSLAALVALEGKCGADTPLLVFCDMRVVDGELNVIHKSFEDSNHFDPKRLAFRQLVAQNVAAGCCMISNKALIDICGTVTHGVKMHDWWVMLVASAFGAIDYVDEQLSLYRQHGNNEVGANDYSPADRAKNNSFVVEQFVLCADQAEAFVEQFGTALDCQMARSASLFAEAGHSKTPLSGIHKLVLSRCWKRGLRKIGQLFAAAVAPKFNEKRGI